MGKKNGSSSRFLLFLVIVVMLIIGKISDQCSGDSKPEISVSKKTEIQKHARKPKKLSEPKYNWDKISSDLVRDYQGEVLSIEQLNSTTCWAQISRSIPNYKAIKVAENIGYYIRNKTGGINGETPSIHVFKGRTHIAVARPSLDNAYNGKLDVKNW